MAEPAVPRRSWLSGLEIYLDRRLLLILAQGFSSGLPFLLTFGTLTAWMSQEGVPKTLIGFMTWSSSVYALKFLWAPVVDQLPIPILTRLMGQRRSWMLLSQIGIAISIVGLSLSDPGVNLAVTAAWAVALASASATQDIVIDAYRIEYLNQTEYGAGAAMTTVGYRAGVLVAGGGALILADSYGWTFSYMTMAALMSIGVITTFLSPEPQRPQTPGFSQGYGVWIKTAVVDPFMEFLTRPGAIGILAFIMLYKYGDALWAPMANPFYLETGFTLTQVGVVIKTYGVVATILGSIFGGVLVARYGIHRTLLWGAISMGLSNLLLAALAMIGPSIPALTVVITIENFANGIGGVALIAFLSSICNFAFTATQYALMTSFMAFTRTILASGGGWLADHMDWVTFFILTTFAAVPGFVLLLWMMRRFPEQRP